MCDIFGAKKAAKKTAAATLQAANMQAAADREAARGTVLSMQTQIAQQKAASRAQELLSTPQQAASVILSATEDAPEYDETTGKRKTTRSQFFNAPTSGVSI